MKAGTKDERELSYHERTQNQWEGKGDPCGKDQRRTQIQAGREGRHCVTSKVHLVSDNK